MKSSSSAPKLNFFQREKKSWFGNIVGDLWGGAVTTFALLPEVIGFMIVVGVHPYMGLFTCIILTILLAFIGGRPGMITAGAGATALILAGLIKEYGMTHPEYIFAATILAGLIQFVLGICRIGSLVKFIPQSVMNGFVNGFAIVIFVSQLKLCINQSIEMYILLAAGIAIIILFPFLKKAIPIGFVKKIPESFVAIVFITAYALIFRSEATNIGDMGSVTASFQYIGYVFGNLGGVFSGECFGAIVGPAVSLAFVGLIESMLTGRMVDAETQTESNKNRECRAQGIGNIVCGSLGAMPGCGMIAMTVTNLKSGGKCRLSQLVAGGLMAALLFSVPFLLESIPLAALCAVMFVVCYHTINWGSIFKVHKIPITETMVMAITAIIVVATENLAIGVGAGLVLTAIFYLLHRFTNAYVEIGISIACLGGAVALGIVGLLGYFDLGFAIGMALAALGAGLAYQSRRNTALKAIAAAVIALCIGVGIANIVGASISMHMGPWFHIIEKATETHAESTLYVK